MNNTEYQVYFKKLEKIWCTCENEATDPYYVADGACEKCEITKHHWHCSWCEGVCQIG